MKQLCLALLLCTVYFRAAAQVSDRFTDNDFTQNPEWTGDDSLFTAAAGELRLNGTAASDAHLCTALQPSDSMEWVFRCRFLLSPSPQNFMRFYLSSDSSNLEGPLNGYYVQLGGVSGSLDSITLYRQTGMQRTRLIAGRPSTVSKSQNHVAVKVFRDRAGNWRLYSDTSGGPDYVLEGEAADNTFLPGGYLGWLVRYTAGNAQRFFLDDVAAYQPVPDTAAPGLDSIRVADKYSVVVYANEALDLRTATDNRYFTLEPGGRNPASVAAVSDRSLLLQFEEALVSKVMYRLHISGLSDRNGNTAGELVDSFLFYQPRLHDLLISELMPDPSPAIGLPEQEFVELYNRSGVPVNLQGFTLSDGSSATVFPEAVLPPGAFITVCSEAAYQAFAALGPAIAVSGMPSLNNTADELTLTDASGTELHRLAYSLSWYAEEEKQDGGWSLELIAPEISCREKAAYRASSDASGGTPGRRNSAWNEAPDQTAPGIASVNVISAKQLVVVFNEPMNSVLLEPATVLLDPSVPVSSATAANDSLRIILSEALRPGRYGLTVKDVSDCSGNRGDASAMFDYVVPQKAAAFDVLIHEIMADPEPVQELPGVEFVELYNRSSKIISLGDWTLSDGAATASLPAIILMPDSFLAIAAAGSLLPDPGFVEIPNFPSLGNTGDELVLRNEYGQVIHAVAYAASWYDDGFKRDGGWSLEMMDPANPCGTANWKASTSRKGGTPGAPNSVRTKNPDVVPPRLVRAYPADSNTLELFFSEPLDSAGFRLSRFRLNQSIHPVDRAGVSPFYQGTQLQFSQAFSPGSLLMIAVDSLADCAGNMLEDYRSTAVEVPYPPDSLSLVINEVLFNARSGAYDFVEVCNKSNRPVDLKTVMIARREDGSVSDARPVIPGGFVLGAGKYAVLTEDPANLQQQYFCEDPFAVIPVALPSYSDNEGIVVLTDKTGRILDELAYEEDMHFALLDNKDGVSLERIGMDRPSDDRSNWTSAAASRGYATPTYRNSHYLSSTPDGNALQLQPPRISPDGDGYEDVMNIRYSFNETGYTGNLWIFDASGRIVRQLAKNEQMGTSGTYTWDGITEKGEKAPAGIYLFRLEAFRLNGRTQEHTAAGVVAEKQ